MAKGVSTAFVIGNGKSRSSFDIRRLRSRGVVYGCNALYREFAPGYELPDYLVAIDPGMIEEVDRSDFPKSRFIVPPLDEQWEPRECNPMRARSNAGINAIREAIKAGHRSVVCLGFDFLIDDRSASVSNIFENTANYGPETRAIYEENSGRRRYLEWVARRNFDVELYFVFPRDSRLLEVDTQFDNVMTLTYDNLERIAK